MNTQIQSRPSSPGKEPKNVTKVVCLLRERIASNELPQGTKLRERHLADEFGVSRQVVRDAFTVLELKRLVVRIERRGAFVAQYDYQDVMDLFDIREPLTTVTYQLAARRAPDGTWDQIAETFGAPMDEVVEANDVKTFTDAISRLDEMASKYAKNDFLDPILEPVIDLTQVLSRRMMLLPKRMELGLELNRRIIKALQERDEEAVADVFREMMDVSRDYLTKYRELLF